MHTVDASSSMLPALDTIQRFNLVFIFTNMLAYTNGSVFVTIVPFHIYIFPNEFFEKLIAHNQ